jgi:hypothetical protein
VRSGHRCDGRGYRRKIEGLLAERTGLALAVRENLELFFNTCDEWLLNQH